MIKFRAWDKNQQIMRGVRGLFWTKNNIVAHCSPMGDKFDEFFTTILNDGEYHLMQSTGLFDKNGVEIFEGDVVIDDYGEINTIVLTEYEDTDYYGQIHLGFISENDDYVDQFITLPSLIKKGTQVIGNIYELESVEE